MCQQTGGRNQKEIVLRNWYRIQIVYWIMGYLLINLIDTGHFLYTKLHYEIYCRLIIYL